VVAPEPAEGGFDPGIAIARAAPGDIGSWDALVDHYGESIVTVTGDFKLSEDDAEEVSQETWIRFHETFCQPVRPADVRSWLAATAWEECRRKLAG
jgi:DNA-directed RNA polymerase specialized sigma24 family protein